ncbi:hypothetical protein OBBRIDRAFT_835905 [Obba rivulosa]|uniref:Uncharacterized protein n=1 Tax=Obba rivulosa TaxID=1052685 RepID=A0A8E2DJT1_9APHY|nr:hypothetical protein OBBRIDRAFT_835905 [Obba rivulosa]
MDVSQKEAIQLLGVMEGMKDHSGRLERYKTPSLDNPLPMLNWLATLFVVNTDGDVTASAMKIDNNSITFYITNNDSIRRSAATDNLLHVFERALAADPTDLNSIYSPFIEFSVKYCYPRIQKKVRKLM